MALMLNPFAFSFCSFKGLVHHAHHRVVAGFAVLGFKQGYAGLKLPPARFMDSKKRSIAPGVSFLLRGLAASFWALMMARRARRRAWLLKVACMVRSFLMFQHKVKDTRIFPGVKHGPAFAAGATDRGVAAPVDVGAVGQAL